MGKKRKFSLENAPDHLLENAKSGLKENSEFECAKEVLRQIEAIQKDRKATDKKVPRPKRTKKGRIS